MSAGITGHTVVLEGFDFICIGKETDYFEFAEARIKHLTEFELKGNQL